MLTFKWSKAYETNIESVDEQHKNLVAMVNKLGESLHEKGELEPEVLEKYFNNIALYAKVHFKDEEAVMDKFNIDKRHQSVHRKAHSMFLQEATKLYGAITKKLMGPEFLFHFLTSWLAIHILGTDKMMAKQVELIEQNHTPNDAFDILKQEVDDSTAPLLVAINQLFTRTMNINHKLLDLNKSLEAQVKLRTHELQQANNNLKAMALTDTLTKLGNRRAAVAFLHNEWKKPFDSQKTITCIMVDVDKFKNINDTLGHDSGDRVLVTIANAIRETARNDDFVCRLGGDEFVVLSNNTNLGGIMQLAEQLRLEANKIKIEFENQCWLGSISIGVAERESGMKTYIDLLKKADEGLYIAKQKGRNCIGCVQQMLES